MLYLFADISSHYEYAHRKRPDWEARFELFAQHLVDSVRRSEADEVVIIGHSSGSFVGVDVITRALKLDPKIRPVQTASCLSHSGGQPANGGLPSRSGVVP